MIRIREGFLINPLVKKKQTCKTIEHNYPYVIKKVSVMMLREGNYQN